MAKKRVQFQEMLRNVRCSIEELPEHRRGCNVQYEIADAGLAAFSVFFMQSPSFLAYQRHMEEQRAQNNARSLFGTAVRSLGLLACWAILCYNGCGPFCGTKLPGRRGNLI